MFNEEYKRRFIAERDQEVTLPQSYLNIQFEKVSKLEERLNKDVCNFTYYEIIEYYKLLNTTSVNSLRVMNSQFSLYTQWCLQQNLVTDSQNHFLEMSTFDYENCINKVLLEKKIVSEATVHEWVNELSNPKDQFILLGIFEGICGKDFRELGNLRPEDIHGNTVKLCTGREVVISDKLRHIIYNCIDEEFYYPINGQRKTKLRDDGYVIKNYCNVNIDQNEYQRGRTIATNLRKILQYVDVFPTVKSYDIKESGKIAMVNKRAIEKGMSAASYIDSEHIKEIENQYDFQFVYKHDKLVFINKYKDYLVE